MRESLRENVLILLQHLIDHRSRHREDLLRFLSTQEKHFLTHAQKIKGNILPFSPSLATWLEKVHYSWFIPTLTPLPERDQLYFLSALERNQAEKLKALLPFSPSFLSLSDLAKSYLHQRLFTWLTQNDSEFLFEEMLPEHPLNKLLSLSKKEIQTLVNYLGVHDLAPEMKHIVKASQLKKIYRALSPGQRSYLQQLLSAYREPILFSRLNLQGSHYTRSRLGHLLHYRGFNRLGKALAGCHPALLWSLSHRLDTGRAKLLSRLSVDINNQLIQERLIEQILHLITYVQQESFNE